MWVRLPKYREDNSYNFSQIICGKLYISVVVPIAGAGLEPGAGLPYRSSSCKFFDGRDLLSECCMIFNVIQ
jgi:hypothetical protein